MSKKSLLLTVEHCLWYESKLGSDFDDAFSRLYHIFGFINLDEQLCYDLFLKFRQNLESPDLLSTSSSPNYSAWSLKPINELKPEDIIHLPKHEMQKVINTLIAKLENKVVKTTLCDVDFESGGYAFAVPYRPAPDNPVAELFENSHLIMKSLLQHGRYLSLHEILTDIYETDQNVKICDKPIINLPLWDVGTSDSHVRNYAPYIYEKFMKIFSSGLIKYTKTTLHSYTEKFRQRVNQNVCKKIYASPESQSLQQVVHAVVRKKDVQRDVFLCSYYAFLDQFMTELAQKVKDLKDDEITPFYSNIWRILLSNLRNIMSQLKSTFTEEQDVQFSQVLQDGLNCWKQIWFDTDKIPNKIKVYLEEYCRNPTGLAVVITPEIIQSYKVLKLYGDGSLSDRPTMLQHYRFISDMLKFYHLPERIKNTWEVLPAKAKRRRVGSNRSISNDDSRD